MAHIISPPHPFLTAKPIGLENANARMVQETFFGINGYSNSMEKYENDVPLDFSKKKQDSAIKRPKEEPRETQNVILEHSACNINAKRLTSTIQHVKPSPKEVSESRTPSPHRASPVNSMTANNPRYFPDISTTLMEQLAYFQAYSKYNPITPKLNITMPLPEQPEPVKKHQDLSPICKMMKNQSFDSGIVSPVMATNTLCRESSALSKNNYSSSLDLLSNNLKFNNATTFSPIMLTPPPSTIAHSPAIQELMTKSPQFSALDEGSILQRTLTASSNQHPLDAHSNAHRGTKSSKQPRPFKAYNPLPKSFSTDHTMLPLGIMQDLEDQEYRYQQFMETYAIKNSKTRTDARSRESADLQARSSGDDRRESSPQSDSSPRPQTSDQNKSFEDSNGSSADAQTSRRQAADTSTSSQNNRSVKRVRSLPDEQKDEAYWERRRKNNEAAKRSRDTRRKKEDYIATRARFLENENKNLRLTVAWLKQQLDTIKCCAAHNHNRF